MINKLVASIIFVSCLFAIFLSINGVEGPIWFGDTFRGFIVNSNRELSQYKFAIPNIPSIPQIKEATGFLAAVNGIVTFLNGLVTLLNFIVLALNTIIQLIEFIFILLKNIITMKDTILSA